MDNPYKVLDVDPKASQQEIRREYRKKAAKAHPDHGGDPDQFILLAEAYATVGDQESRKHFDETGEKKKQNTEENKAVCMFAEAFMNALMQEGEQIFYKAIFKDIRGMLQQKLVTKEAQINELKKVNRHMSKVLKRVSRKKGADPIVESTMDSAILQNKNNICLIRQDIPIVEKAMAICNGYEFRKDDPEHRPLSAYGNRYRGLGIDL